MLLLLGPFGDMTAQTIFTAMSLWTPTFDSDVTIKVWNYNQIKETLPSAGTPIRILQPLLSPGDFAFIALGKTNKVTWKIVDLLLIKPVAQGDGIKSESAHIVDYCDSYREAMYSNRAPTGGSHILSATMEPGVYPWNNIEYFGVKCTVSVEDFLSPA
jgi:hypothetical protein